LRDPDISTQPALGQAVAPKKRPLEAYSALRWSIIGFDLPSDRLFTIIPVGLRASLGAAFHSLPSTARARMDRDTPLPKSWLQPAAPGG